MADNDLDIEGLIDSIRGHEPSQEPIIFEDTESPPDGTAQFISVEEVMAGPSAIAPGPLLFGIPGPGYTYPTAESMIANGLPDLVPPPDVDMVSGLIMPSPEALFPSTMILQSNNGPSVTLSATGTLVFRQSTEEPGFIVDLRQQATTVANLEERIASLEQLVNLLGQALSAQIDDEVLSALTPEERSELRHVVTERNTNQQMRLDRRNADRTPR